MLFNFLINIVGRRFIFYIWLTIIVLFVEVIDLGKWYKSREFFY